MINDGELAFQEFECQAETPCYAILSHTWHIDNSQEVTYTDLQLGVGRHKAGYDKIRFCQEQSARDGLFYFWIDVCCVNRDSSAELSEAINSMFRWYKNSARYDVYLADITDDKAEYTFGSSRWFTRGWTLQELLAPRIVQFFDASGGFLGDKISLETKLMAAMQIPAKAIRGELLQGFTVAEGMSWAKTRVTKREEDRVYCLLGIFDVSIPIVYGEGADHAFKRLHEEITRNGRSCFLKHSELQITDERQECWHSSASKVEENCTCCT